MRRCVKCWKLKPLSEFSKHLNNGQCRSCLGTSLDKVSGYKHLKRRHEKYGTCVVRGCNEPATKGVHCLRHSIFKNWSSKVSRKFKDRKGIATLKGLDMVLSRASTNLETGDSICEATGELINWYKGTAVLGFVRPLEDFHVNHNWLRASNMIVESLQHSLVRLVRVGNSSVSKRWRDKGRTTMRGCESKKGGSAFGMQLKSIFESKAYWQCPYLGYDLDTDLEVSIDHIVPLSKGGLNELSNLQFISRAANAIKGANSHEWMCSHCGVDFEPDRLIKYIH